MDPILGKSLINKIVLSVNMVKGDNSKNSLFWHVEKSNIWLPGTVTFLKNGDRTLKYG